MNRKQQCIHCGEAVRPDAASCWYCGSDYETGWSDKTYLDGIDLPEDFNYNDALEHEFGKSARTEKRKEPWFRNVIVGVAIVMIAVMLFGVLKSIL